MLPNDSIRPLHDVWLRPRRVFRELLGQPVGPADYVLGAIQGMVSSLAMSRWINAGAVSSVLEIFLQAGVFGSIFGIIGLFLFAEIYARLGTLAGGSSNRRQVIHVLAYGGLPVAVSLGLWVFTAALAGHATFMKEPPPDAESFIVLLLYAHFVAFELLFLWSVVLQVMGFSEVQGLKTGKALGVWVLGQLVAFIASLVLLRLLSLVAPVSTS